MNKIEKKIKLLQAEGKDRSAMPFLMMNSEQQLMVERTKELTFTYSMIILKMGNFRIVNRDQNFFETMIYFISQVLKEFFDRDDYKLIDEGKQYIHTFLRDK